MATGGLILLDDYGFESCPGVRKATNEFFARRSEKIVELSTGQALVFVDNKNNFAHD